MKDSSVIYKEMKAQLEESSGVLFGEDGDMALRLRAVAVQIESLWTQLDWTKGQVFPQTAAGSFLDLHARARGLLRGDGSFSVGVLRFETAAAALEAVSIPLGTVCVNGAGAEFVTTGEGSILAGESFCLVAAKARDLGSGGNAPAGTVCFMSLAPVGVARCFNPEAFTGGTDGEDDESLRQRILKSFESLPNGSNAAYYETAVRNFPGVAAALVLPKNRGLGTVDIIVSGEDGIPSNELIGSISTLLNAQREICVDIAVSAPSLISVPVTASIEVEEGFDPTLVQGAVETALGAYFDGRLLGQNILRAKLGSIIFSVPGVKNYNITQPGADLTVESTKLPTAGLITITRS